MSSLDRFQNSGRVPALAAKLDGTLKYKFYESHEEIEYAPEPKCCHVIVTCKSLMWTLMTSVASLLVTASIVTPQWLVGKPRWVGLNAEKINDSVQEYQDQMYRPTLGLFNQCTKELVYGRGLQQVCVIFVTGIDMDDEDFPHFWKSALVSFALAVVLLCFTILTSVSSLCCQAICKKSIFTVSGLIQSIAGFLLVVGMVLYPAGWYARRIKNLCGNRSQAFLMDECSFGWAFYTMIIGVLLIFISSLLSIKAEEATSSDKVESEVLDGKSCICII